MHFLRIWCSFNDVGANDFCQEKRKKFLWERQTSCRFFTGKLSVLSIEVSGWLDGGLNQYLVF